MEKSIDIPLDEIWVRIEKVMNENSELHKDLHVTYHFKIKNGDELKCYQLQLCHGEVTVEQGGSEDPDCTLILPIESFTKMLLGNLNGTAAFMTGKLKVNGNLGLALKLKSLLGEYDVKAYL